MKILILVYTVCLFWITNIGQSGFNGLGINMGNLHMFSDAESRSVSPEYFTGEKGNGGMAKPEDEVVGINGKGYFVGVYMAWGMHNTGWWGEGKIKFFIDRDSKFTTICWNSTENYFCGSYGFDRNSQYKEYCMPYVGLHQVNRSDATHKSQQRFGLYRWHVTDPMRFKKVLRITMQGLCWRHWGPVLAPEVGYFVGHLLGPGRAPCEIPGVPSMAGVGSQLNGTMLINLK